MLRRNCRWRGRATNVHPLISIPLPLGVNPKSVVAVETEYRLGARGEILVGWYSWSASGGKVRGVDIQRGHEHIHAQGTDSRAALGV